LSSLVTSNLYLQQIHKKDSEIYELVKKATGTLKEIWQGTCDCVSGDVYLSQLLTTQGMPGDYDS